jgi:hypothetical protein
MMQLLANVVEPGADFFVEDLAINAIVFDADDDDATLWMTAIFDGELHFFQTAASFADLSTLLRLSGDRGPAIEEELAEALTGTNPPTTLSFTDPETGAEEHPAVLEFASDDRPPILLPNVALKLSFTFFDEEETESAFNVFAIGGIYLQIT